MGSETPEKGLIDSDVVIDAIRGVEVARAFLISQIDEFGGHTSVITAIEVVEGCQDKAAVRKAHQLLDRMTILPLSKFSSTLAFELVDRYILRHGLLGPDALVGATAIE